MSQTEYIIFSDTGECDPQERGGSTMRQAAINLATSLMQLEPHLDWWVESRTRIWEHEAEPQP